VEVNCTYCHKLFIISKGEYNKRKKHNQRGMFCSWKCATTEHNVSPEMRRAISIAQKGVSVPARGRFGHSVSEATKEKIRLKKLGRPAPVDTAIIISELKFRKIEKYFAMVGLIPDAVFIQDGKLVALEVEKERWETGIRRKMAAYNNRPEYEKVILVWYSPSGKRLKEWHKDNGEWKLID
jgi:hypothetical protein